jgi:glycosyltransferase involved in cell wall biosynthesis
MDKLRVGVIVYENSLPTEGGGHSYYDSLLKGINDFDFHPDIEIINVVFYKKAQPSLNLKKKCIYIKGSYDHNNKLRRNATDDTHSSSKRRNFFFSQQNPFVKLGVDFIKYKHNHKIEEILKANKVDLVYYLKVEFNTLNYPFVATHWDVAHKSMQAFPETSLNGNFEDRERYFQYTLSKAFVILCESETGKKELKSFYSLYHEKLKVLPIFASRILNEKLSEESQAEILRKYGLMDRHFFIYPAQFWPSKNHYNLIIAFKKLISEESNQRLKLVLSGSDKGNLSYVKELIKHLNLEESVIITGFITNTELYAFYKNAIALTMPTFLGPTNMPLLEAAHLQCAVLCSDLEGHREMLGDNALYFEPSNADAIYNAMKQILDEDFRKALVHASFRDIQSSPFNIHKSLETLNKILLEIIPIRKAWGIDF